MPRRPIALIIPWFLGVYRVHGMRFLSCTRSGLSFLLPGIEPFDNVVSKTIVATALPTIVSKLGGGSRYSWVGRFVPSSQRLSIKVIDLLLHALVPTCWPQPGVLSILLFLSLNLIIFPVFHLCMGNYRISSVGNPYCTLLLPSS
jgi:hypothetical protein